MRSVAKCVQLLNVFKSERLYDCGLFFAVLFVFVHAHARTSFRALPPHFDRTFSALSPHFLRTFFALSPHFLVACVLQFCLFFPRTRARVLLRTFSALSLHFLSTFSALSRGVFFNFVLFFHAHAHASFSAPSPHFLCTFSTLSRGVFLQFCLLFHAHAHVLLRTFPALSQHFLRGVFFQFCFCHAHARVLLKCSENAEKVRRKCAEGRARVCVKKQTKNGKPNTHTHAHAHGRKRETDTERARERQSE